MSRKTGKQEVGTNSKQISQTNTTTVAIVNDDYKKKRLLEWDENDVQTFLKKDNADSTIAAKFSLLNGPKLAKLTKETIQKEIGNIVGEVLFNDIQDILKKDQEAISNKSIQGPSTTILASNNNKNWVQVNWQGPIQMKPTQDLANSTNNFVEIHNLDVGGLSKSNESNWFYIRKDWKSIWKLLNGKWTDFDGYPTKYIFFTGPPGTGKSSLAWAWSCSFAAANPKKQVRWLSFSAKKLSEVQEVKLEGSHLYYRHLNAIKDLDWKDINNPNVELIILDGYRDDIRPCISTNVRVLYVQSMPIWLSSDDDQYMNPLEIYSFGWSLEEYFEACEDANFWKQVQPFLNAPSSPVSAIPSSSQNFKLLTQEQKLSIVSKFYYAGMSAHWMFSCSWEKVKKSISKAIEKVKNISVFCHGIIGANSDHDINTLYSSVPPKIPISSSPKFHFHHLTGSENVIVSQYVLFCFKDKVNSAFISAATKHALKLGMSVFDGWIFKLDFLLHLSPGHTISFTSTLETGDENNWKLAQKWPISITPLEFSAPVDIKNHLPSLKHAEFQNCWLLPNKEIQPCFDAMCLYKKTINKKVWNVFRVIQITRSQSHSALISYLEPFYAVLKEIGFDIDWMELIAVVPEFQTSFKWDNWDGGSAEFRKRLVDASSSHCVTFKRDSI